MSDGTKRLFAVDELALNVVNTRSFGQGGRAAVMASLTGSEKMMKVYQIGGMLSADLGESGPPEREGARLH